jgi:hypothetical protein
LPSNIKLRTQFLSDGSPENLGRLLYTYLHPLLGADEVSGYSWQLTTAICVLSKCGCGDFFCNPIDILLTNSIVCVLFCRKPGLSKFFGGKSKSFSSLADAKSISDLAKPENPYARRRKMGYNCHLDRHRSYPPLSRSSVTGISKKSVNGSRITLAVALKLGGIDEDDKEEATSHPASSRSSLNTSFPSRSFSLTDLPVAGSPSPPLRRTIGQL